MSKLMTLEQIQAAAQGNHFANYEGGSKRVGGEAYGSNAVSKRASYEGGTVPAGVNFTSEKIHTITVNNTTEADVSVCLFGAYERVTPQSTTKLVIDGAIITGVLGSGSPKSVLNVQNFVSKNPSRVLGFKIRTNTESQLAEMMKINYQSPFNNMPDENIDLSSFTSEASQNAKLLTVARPFQLDNQTELTVNIPAGAKTSFTFYFGAILNTAAALDAKS